MYARCEESETESETDTEEEDYKEKKDQSWCKSLGGTQHMSIECETNPEEVASNRAKRTDVSDDEAISCSKNVHKGQDMLPHQFQISDGFNRRGVHECASAP